MPASKSQTPGEDFLTVISCNDFQVSGDGQNDQWSKTNWHSLQPIKENDLAFSTRFKIMYSSKGIYILAECEDRNISTSYNIDQGDIWNGDVFEVFLQTDPENPLYFEYEINALNAELAILVPNLDGNFFGWAPWHYEGDRKVQKAVKIHGGIPEEGAKIDSWTVELFFPFALFKALKNVPPVSGTIWKGNFYRMDYDGGERKLWAWKPISKNFHEYQKFGTIVFQ